jgi:hypothetical protein
MAKGQVQASKFLKNNGNPRDRDQVAGSVRVSDPGQILPISYGTGTATSGYLPARSHLSFAPKLQRPLPDEVLCMVAQDEKDDGAAGYP